MSGHAKFGANRDARARVLSLAKSLRVRFMVDDSRFRSLRPFYKTGLRAIGKKSGAFWVRLEKQVDHRRGGVRVEISRAEYGTSAVSPGAPSCSHDSRPRAGRSARRCARW